MSINEHPNAKFFAVDKVNKDRIFKRANNPNSKKRLNRIKLEEELTRKFLEEKKNG